MESEKKDYISNQETTAVYYKKPNQKMIDRYLQIYEKAKENKNIKACYLGLDKQFRIISRDSYISILTDPEVMFEYTCSTILMVQKPSTPRSKKKIFLSTTWKSLRSISFKQKAMKSQSWFPHSL